MIGELMGPNGIILDLEVREKERVLRTLAEGLRADGAVSDVEEFLAHVAQREAQGTTSVGHGLAIPHAKSSAVVRPALAMGRTREEIQEEALDGTRPRLFFMIAVPQGDDSSHLKVLSSLARLVMHQEVREGLLSAKDPEEVRRIISEAEGLISG
ncbi:putative PTS IIA-like nitrogen-regulatory protein PtsN [Thermanaerovibrio acidaminovorans DSM 6589]|jgi:fructose-specific phosphotransferase system IIA component|uniref:PTS IIA-like nitrogen-regulatory protein PtsN n=1 Tax=Thermanaerovibrio acidaminovorans (strain ATCC 49978 / DSM 6589 / Su883) TaxID=525903 RepID=D1B7D9_THEAS|nr:PTS sugar transporter subunit IIA [Thermanaerovibrio acidaminovorans]ACZ19930.1 putative PTS IIA-like nitrogen-regulatory protein PtsN [Thermanaerovibrio acidaminovorans DSM 6589]